MQNHPYACLLLLPLVLNIGIPLPLLSPTSPDQAIEKKLEGNKELDAALVQAVEQNSPPDVERLLAQGADANARDKDGNNVLALALNRFGSFEGEDRRGVPIAMSLLKHGANANVFRGTEPVLTDALCCIHVTPQKYLALIRLLLQCGARINTPDREGKTPLMYAAHMASEIKSADAFHLLLAQGANPKAVARDGKTILMSVAEGGKNKAVILKILKDLQDKGLDVNAKTHSGETPLMWAAMADNLTVLTWLLTRGSHVDAVDSDYGWTPLIWAIKRTGNKAVVETLLKKGASLHRRDKAGWTPFQMAAEAYDKLEVLQLLLSKTKDIEQPGAQGETLLMHACGATKIQNVRYLLQRGADVNHRDRYGMTPLMWAIQRHKGTAPPQDTAGGDPTTGDSDETLALVQMLLAHGARRDIRTKTGQTAMDIAREENQIKTMKLLSVPATTNSGG